MFEYRVLGSLVLVACLCACGNGTAAPAGASSRAPSSAAVDRSDPGSVAVAFTLAMASQDYAAATPLFDPAKRGILSALALGAQSSSAGASGKLSSGRQRISGDSGSVALVGQLCRNGSGGRRPRRRPRTASRTGIPTRSRRCSRCRSSAWKGSGTRPSSSPR